MHPLQAQDPCDGVAVWLVSVGLLAGHTDSGILMFAAAAAALVDAAALTTRQAGAGLVADSVPESEYEETLNKAAALGRAIDLAEQAFVQTRCE